MIEEQLHKKIRELIKEAKAAGILIENISVDWLIINHINEDPTSHLQEIRVETKVPYYE